METRNKISLAPYIALLISTVTPWLILILFTSDEVTSFIIFLAIPFSLALMIFVGLPTYLLLKKARLLNLPLCMLTGMLCSLPIVIILTRAEQPLQFLLATLAYLSPVGAFGGLIFWLIYGRTTQQRETRKALATGFTILSVVCVVLLRVYLITDEKRVRGVIPENELPYLLNQQRQVPVMINGERKNALLAANKSYRQGCDVMLYSWRDFFSGRQQYQVNYYPGSPKTKQCDRRNIK